MVALREETIGNYSRNLVVSEVNDEILEQTWRIFAKYKARSIMLNDSFDDDVWKISDEKRTFTLMNFQLGVKQLPGWLGCSAEDYRTSVKAYIALNLGKFTAFTLQEIARKLFSLISMDNEEILNLGKQLNHIAAFLQLLPGGTFERDMIIEQIAEVKFSASDSVGKKQQRILANFQSYLRFNDVLTDFWASAINEEKLFYFPLYFWWNLTAILPLRVTEFLLTPRDCLTQSNGKYFITVRRSRLKGNGKSIAYRIDDDYELKTYGISGSLAHNLTEYINATNQVERTELNTLLSTKPHYCYCGINTTAWGRRYYTYANLALCMQKFREKVINQSGKEIGEIHFGDTRHLAMVNLIITGGSPVICRELAGHADIDISSHYYSNISNLVECITLERLRKLKGDGDATATGKQKYSLAKPNKSQRVTDGYCNSETFRNHDISECLKAIGPDGQIGDCKFCANFLPDNQGIQFEFTNEASAKAAVDADSRYLMQMVEIVRKGLGYSEDIGSALLRLQYSSNHYSNIIQEKYDNVKT
ncbi:hypothetical protein FACS1894219_00090 [Clostridia bacterium]|nr:hypothetical protein FACS1894219_00090 [Clostridia bacterium]